ncbi:MAG: hypothetical protein V2I33_23035, partial [Kangiellaceae bacterium]|nr:hypothetical protein [Kangiellaceae bacterium]
NCASGAPAISLKVKEVYLVVWRWLQAIRNDDTASQHKLLCGLYVYRSSVTDWWLVRRTGDQPRLNGFVENHY